MTQNEHVESPTETIQSPNRRRRRGVAFVGGLGVAAAVVAGGVITNQTGGESPRPVPSVQETSKTPEVDKGFQEKIAAGLIAKCEIESVRLTNRKVKGVTSQTQGRLITEVEISGKINETLLAQDKPRKDTKRAPIAPRMNLRELDGQQLIAGGPIEWKRPDPKSYVQVEGTADMTPNPTLLTRMKNHATYDIFEELDIRSGESSDRITTKAKKYCGSITYTKENGELKVHKSSDPLEAIGTVHLTTRGSTVNADGYVVDGPILTQKTIPPQEVPTE